MGTDSSDSSCCYFLVEFRSAPDASRAAVPKKSRTGVRTFTATRSNQEHPLKSEASVLTLSLRGQPKRECSLRLRIRNKDRVRVLLQQCCCVLPWGEAVVTHEQQQPAALQKSIPRNHPFEQRHEHERVAP
jgi:hypothetical protein